MSRKPKFKPEITRVKLNPEQAVLACSCYDRGMASSASGTDTNYCRSNMRGWAKSSGARAELTTS